MADPAWLLGLALALAWVGVGVAVARYMGYWGKR
jgi:hypothetical protein